MVKLVQMIDSKTQKKCCSFVNVVECKEKYKIACASKERDLVRVAVIVPVYNTAKYLKECLESLLRQVHGNYKIFAVDDGSTDGSSLILDEYLDKTEKLDVVHIENHGVAFARNIALEKIEEEGGFDLISFCDSDDVVTSDFLKNYVDGWLRYSAQFIVVGYISFDKKGFVNNSLKKNHSDTLIHGDEIFEFGFTDYMKSSPAYSVFIGNVCFAAEAIRGIRFDVSKRIAEDQDFRFRALQHCKRGLIISDVVYHYRLRKCSLSHESKYSTANLTFCLRWLRELKEMSPSLRKILENRAIKQWEICVKRAYEQDLLDRCWSELERYLEEIDLLSRHNDPRRFTIKMFFFRRGIAWIKIYMFLRCAKRRGGNGVDVTKFGKFFD